MGIDNTFFDFCSVCVGVCVFPCICYILNTKPLILLVKWGCGDIFEDTGRCSQEVFIKTWLRFKWALG